MTARLQLLARDGCHLCAEAIEQLTTLAGPPGATWTVVDVDSDPELRAEWGDMVPVLLAGDRVVEWGRISPDSLRAALATDRKM